MADQDASATATKGDITVLKGDITALKGDIDSLKGNIDSLKDVILLKFEQHDRRFDDMEKLMHDSDEHILLAFDEQGKHIDEVAADILLAMEQKWADQNDVVNDKFSLFDDRLRKVETAKAAQA